MKSKLFALLFIISITSIARADTRIINMETTYVVGSVTEFVDLCEITIFRHDPAHPNDPPLEIVPPQKPDSSGTFHFIVPNVSLYKTSIRIWNLEHSFFKTLDIPAGARIVDCGDIAPLTTPRELYPTITWQKLDDNYYYWIKKKFQTDQVPFLQNIIYQLQKVAGIRE